MAATGVELFFEACETRFNAKASLKAIGRKLSMENQSTKPWTEFEIASHGTDDGFGDDLEVYGVRFTYHGKYPTVRKASNWLELITDAFDDYIGLAVTGYATSGFVRLDADDGPELIDGVWEARAEYEVTLHRDTLKPAVRGA